LKVYNNDDYICYIIPANNWCSITVSLDHQSYNTIKVKSYHSSEDGTWSAMVNYIQFTIFCSYSSSGGGGGGGGGGPPPPPIF
jgi:hypothetical protein